MEGVIDKGSVLWNLSEVGVQIEIVLAFVWNYDWLTWIQAEIRV